MLPGHSCSPAQCQVVPGSVADDADFAVLILQRDPRCLGCDAGKRVLAARLHQHREIGFDLGEGGSRLDGGIQAGWQMDFTPIPAQTYSFNNPSTVMLAAPFT